MINNAGVGCNYENDSPGYDYLYILYYIDYIIYPSSQSASCAVSPTAGIVGGRQPPAEPASAGAGSWYYYTTILPQCGTDNEGCHHLQEEAAAGAPEPHGVLCPLSPGPLQAEEAGEAD